MELKFIRNVFNKLNLCLLFFIGRNSINIYMNNILLYKLVSEQRPLYSEVFFANLGVFGHSQYSE